MDLALKIYIRKWKDVTRLVFRNVFLLINAIIFSVSVLLIIFGDIKEGFLLGGILFINTIVGIIRDIHAWTSLEKLQILTAVKVIKVDDGLEISVLPEEIKVGDKIKLKLGDQVPSDGVLIDVYSLEVNEGVLTGESHSFPKSKGEIVFAGSIVTSGSCLLEARSTFKDSRIAKMTENVKKFSTNNSQIQHSVNLIVRYFGYLLLFIIPIVVYIGISKGDALVLIVKNIGAISSMTVPQGLVIATTLMFAYGAIYSFKRNVLLQEINASEKFGRIKNLCLDKTGTLTENTLEVEEVYIPVGISRDKALLFSLAYIDGSGDSSETISAIKKFIKGQYSGDVGDILSFSSDRMYGGVQISGDFNKVILAGAPEVFSEHIYNKSDKEWFDDLLKINSSTGHRIISFVGYDGKNIPNDLSNVSLYPIAIFILHNNLRKGIVEAIDFFQKRGVKIRIISGDNLETVSSLSRLAGVKNTDQSIIGQEIESWTKEDFKEKSKNYFIFARVKPEQKEKIIEGLKSDGFTAMVGDGANDALAIKKADLGIAMFEGAKATRQLASVVLMNNSFSEFPNAVKLADNLIENIEIFTTIFLNQTFLGFLVFLFVFIFGYNYPFTPLNITFINYFNIGIPSLLIFYWLLHLKEVDQILPGKTFLKKVTIFPLISIFPQFLAIVSVFIFVSKYFKNIKMNTPMVLSFIGLGTLFFFSIQSIYNKGHLDKIRKKQFVFTVILEILLLVFAFRSPLLKEVFNIISPAIPIVIFIIFISIIYATIQNKIIKIFLKNERYLIV